MNVAYVLPYDWGGMPHYTSELANAVSEHADVTVYGSKRMREDYFSDRVELVKCFDAFDFTINQPLKAFSPGGLRSMLSYRNIRAIEEKKPDIIHLTTPLPPQLSFFISFYGLDRRYPMVHTKHGIFSNSGRKVRFFEDAAGFFEGLVTPRATVVHTENDKNILCRRRPGAEVFVIPHGLYSFFRGSRRTSSAAEKSTILFFGNIRKYKGLETLLAAVPLICGKMPDLKLIIAGEGNLLPYSDLMGRCGSNLEVHNEFIPDQMVAELFWRSQVVVLPYSKMSGQSGVLNIAYAFKKPVVASDVGGITELVEDGKTGCVVKPDDPEALADAVIRLLSDDELRTRMSRSIGRLSKELSWSTIAGKHIELYAHVLGSAVRRDDGGQKDG